MDDRWHLNAWRVVGETRHSKVRYVSKDASNVRGYVENVYIL